jgi:hypothetical protein
LIIVTPGKIEYGEKHKKRVKANFFAAVLGSYSNNLWPNYAKHIHFPVIPPTARPQYNEINARKCKCMSKIAIP